MSIFLQNFIKNKALMVEALAAIEKGTTQADFMISWQIKMLKDFAGVREVGENLGEEVEFFQRATGTRGLAYCASFLIKIIDDGVCKTLGLKDAIPRFAGTQKIYEWAKQKNLLNDTGYKPGDLVVWRKYKLEEGNYKETGQGHVACVLEVFPDRKVIKTIEGNTNPAGSRDGDGVYERERSYNFQKQSNTLRLRGAVDMVKVYNKLISESQKEIICQV